MPIAMEAGARSMGLSIGDFIKQVETGSVLAKDFMLPFARELRRTVRENGALAAAQEKLTAQQQRMNTEFKVLIDDIFQGGLSKTIGNVFKLIADAVQRSAPRIKEFFLALGDGIDIVTKLTRSLFGMSGELDNNSKSAGALLRTWWGILSVWYTALQLLDLLAEGMEKLPSWEKTVSLVSGVPGFSMIEHALKSPFMTGSGGGKNTTVNVGSVNLTTTSGDPEKHAMEFMNLFSHQLGAY